MQVCSQTSSDNLLFYYTLPVVVSETEHKIVWNDFEQALLDPHDCMDAGAIVESNAGAVAEDARVISNLEL